MNLRQIAVESRPPDHDIRDNNYIVLKGLGIMKRMKPFVTESVLQIIYKSSVILPYISIIVYGMGQHSQLLS
jgi:hypothetical protein